LKGIGSDFDWNYFKSCMVEGKIFYVNDSIKTNQIIISREDCQYVEIENNDTISMHFIQDPPRMRRFIISGIYETNLEEFDKIYVFAISDISRKLNGMDRWTR